MSNKHVEELYKEEEEEEEEEEERMKRRREREDTKDDEIVLSHDVDDDDDDDDENENENDGGQRRILIWRFVFSHYKSRNMYVSAFGRSSPRKRKRYSKEKKF